MVRSHAEFERPSPRQLVPGHAFYGRDGRRPDKPSWTGTQVAAGAGLIQISYACCVSRYSLTALIFPSRSVIRK